MEESFQSDQADVPEVLTRTWRKQYSISGETMRKSLS